MRLPQAVRRAALASGLWAALGGTAGAAPSRDPAAELAAMETTPEGQSVARDALTKAKVALERSRSMARAGDTRHAPLLVAVALEWIDVARDLVRTVKAESRAAAAEKRLDELSTRLKRSRALLEETVARRGRAREVLEQVESPSPTPPPAPRAPASPARPGS